MKSNRIFAVSILALACSTSFAQSFTVKPLRVVDAPKAPVVVVPEIKAELVKTEPVKAAPVVAVIERAEPKLAAPKVITGASAPVALAADIVREPQRAAPAGASFVPPGAVPNAAMNYAQAPKADTKKAAKGRGGKSAVATTNDVAFAPAAIDQAVGAVLEREAKTPFKVRVDAQGVARHAFGFYTPRVVTAVNRVSVIEFEPGETITFQSWGSGAEAEEWGPAWVWGPNNTPMLAVRPAAPGLTTDLFVYTNKRVYAIYLSSTSDNFVPRTGFYYPTDASTQLAALSERSRIEAHVEAAKPEQITAKVGIQFPAISEVTQGYDIKGDAPFKPQRILTNGKKTWIEFPAGFSNEALPALFGLNANGEEAYILVRPAEGENGLYYYIVDFPMKRGVLKIGTGRKAVSVEFNLRDKDGR